VDCIIHWATDLVVIRVWVLKDGPATPIINIHDATSIKEASPLISDFKPFSKWDLNQVCSSASNFWLHKFNNNNSSTIIYHCRPAPTRLKIVLSQNPISTHVNLIQTSTWKGKKTSSSLHGCVKCQIDYANLNMNCWTCRKLIWWWSWSAKFCYWWMSKDWNNSTTCKANKLPSPQPYMKQQRSSVLKLAIRYIPPISFSNLRCC
jgi:hypothetical protein